ncbi:phosphate ABC transporter permease PstA [Ruminiclostridium josui]|uniref:phosphate ABC transporter permease PstA n=1 Tax=Ruminiclostridium josui TaxID=1499 RepID=UPI000463EF12|nr:phosphate ABC transporter permease PstA [Ruminiclostridium josui]
MNQIKYRKMKNSIFHGVIFCITLIGIVVLVILLADIIMRGVPYLTKHFFTNFPSRFPKKAGILPGIYGSIYIILLTILFSVPIGLGTAVYLEEYAKKNRFTKFIKINISNLSGTPSIVYGLLGLTVFVKTLGLGKSVLAGALTMSLVVLPIVIVASQEAIKAVPQYLRHGSYALGATKWQTIRKIVIPAALPGIFTGVILSVSRALGETAPLIMVGAATYVSKLPEGLNSIFTALPMQIYYWMGLPKEQFKDLAAAGIIVLLGILLTTNAIAIVLRNKYQKSIE